MIPQYIIKDFDFTKDKAIIRHLVNKVIIKDKQKLQILCGEFRLPSLAEELGYELKDRNAQITTPPLILMFSFPTPKPRKRRIITERESVTGRIIHSRPTPIHR